MNDTTCSHLFEIVEETFDDAFGGEEVIVHEVCKFCGDTRPLGRKTAWARFRPTDFDLY